MHFDGFLSTSSNPTRHRAFLEKMVTIAEPYRMEILPRRGAYVDPWSVYRGEESEFLMLAGTFLRYVGKREVKYRKKNGTLSAKEKRCINGRKWFRRRRRRKPSSMRTADGGWPRRRLRQSGARPQPARRNRRPRRRSGNGAARYTARGRGSEEGMAKKTADPNADDRFTTPWYAIRFVGTWDPVERKIIPYPPKKAAEMNAAQDAEIARRAKAAQKENA